MNSMKNEQPYKGNLKRLHRVISENITKINLKSKIPFPPKKSNKNSKQNSLSKKTKQKLSNRLPLVKDINSSNTYHQLLTISTNITTQTKKVSCLNIINESNFNAIKKKINFHKKENTLIRTRSGKKNFHCRKTSSSCLDNSSTSNKENINVNFNNSTFNGFENSTFNCENKRTINDIKEEYLITIRNNESIQNKIQNDADDKMKILKEKYKKIFDDIPKEINLQEQINKINLGNFSYNINNLELNKNNNSLFTRKEYKQLLTTENKLEYGNSILEEYFLKQEITKDILLKHEITPKMRLKMVDWMIEVFHNLKCKDITFFTAVNLMDRFFIKTKNKYLPENLHLIGMCSIFIASKFCEIYPIKLNILIQKVGHNKFSKEEILKMEEIIMINLDYDILRPSSLEFAEYFFEELFSFFENNFNIHNKCLGEYLKEFIVQLNVKITLDKFYFDKCESVQKYTDKMRSFLWLVVIYLLKMCCHDYEITQEKPSLIAASCILVGIRICEILNKENYVNELFMENISKISKENQYSLLLCSSNILSKTQNFQKEYEGVYNLYNTHFEVISKIQFHK